MHFVCGVFICWQYTATRIHGHAHVISAGYYLVPDVCPHVQAMLLDILLVLPRLIESVFTPPASGAGLQMYAHSQSFVWVFITTWVVFGIVSSLMGHYARIPFVGDAAEQQIR